MSKGSGIRRQYLLDQEEVGCRLQYADYGNRWKRIHEDNMRRFWCCEMERRKVRREMCGVERGETWRREWIRCNCLLKDRDTSRLGLLYVTDRKQCRQKKLTAEKREPQRGRWHGSIQGSFLDGKAL